MEYKVLGKTDLNVSVMGLGCGGPSRVGHRTGRSDGDSVRLVKKGLDSGINIFDTSEAYRTEHVVGKALRTVRRDAVIISASIISTTFDRICISMRESI